MKKSVILISGIDFFLQSSAAYTRVLNYAKALKTFKINVYFTSIKNPKIFTLHGNRVKEIKFYNLPKFVTEKKSKIYTLFLNEFSFKFTYEYLRSILKFAKKIDNEIIYLFYPYKFSLTFLSLFYLKLIKNQKVFIEKNEMQFAIRLNYQAPPNFIDKILLLILQIFFIPLKFFEDLLSIFYTGIIAISTRIEKFYKALFVKNIIRIPILVDITNFIPKRNYALKNQKIINIGIIGSITNKKDKFFEVAQIVAKEQIKGKNLRLNLYGSTSKTSIKIINELKSCIKAGNDIFYYGEVSNLDVPGILKNQQILLLIRQGSLQNQFGFSTKLAEYLASGTPVLTTNVSDIPLYLKDHENAFLIETSGPSYEIIYKKLMEIIDCTNIDNITKTAFDTVKQNFDYHNYSLKIKKFLFGNSISQK